MKIFLIIILFSSFSQSSLLDKCYDMFKSKTEIVLSIKQSSLKHEESKMIVSHLYEYLPLLEGNYLSEKETKNYILQTEKLIQLMEENSIKTYKRFEILEPYLTPALKKTSQIIYFMQSKQNELNEKYEYLDTKTILNLILSTLSQHLYTYLTHPQSKNLDWSRLRIILESISQFNSEQPAFSLYKIYRSVREKYSLKEYINCN